MILIILASVILCIVRCQPTNVPVEPVHATRSRRSVGSLPTSIENYPYVASIRNSGLHKCGGTILTKDIILTAARCVPSENPIDLLTVKVGDEDINYKGSWHSVSKVVRYGEDKSSSKESDESGSSVGATWGDVALIKLENSISLNNETTGIVPLVEADDDIYDYDRGIVVGWGRVPVIIEVSDPSTAGNKSQIIREKLDRLPSKLMAVELNVASKSKCIELGPSVTYEDLFCTYSLGRKPCYEDVGGPFIVKGRQAGIVTDNRGEISGACNEDSNTGFFIQVAKYREWIDKQAEVLSKPE